MRSTLLVVAFAASAAALRVVPRPIEVQPTRRDALATSAAVFGAFATLSLPQAALAAPPATLASTFSFESQITPLIGGLDVIGLSRFEDQLSTPKGSALPSVKVKFDFPTQWTRLNSGGGIVYVDGATGLKTYVLKVPLPPRDEADGGGVLPLSETPKAYLGQALFAQGGALAKDAEIDDFKVSSAKMVDGSARYSWYMDVLLSLARGLADFGSALPLRAKKTVRSMGKAADSVSRTTAVSTPPSWACPSMTSTSRLGSGAMAQFGVQRGSPSQASPSSASTTPSPQ